MKALVSHRNHGKHRILVFPITLVFNSQNARIASLACGHPDEDNQRLYENDDENRDLGLIFNFDFVETAMLVTCINKFPHTRLLAVFNFQLALPCQAKNKNRLLSVLS